MLLLFLTLSSIMAPGISAQAAGLNLNLLKTTVKPSTAPPPPSTLPANMLPLCGNSRIDTIQDYQTQYNSLTPPASMAARLPPGPYNGTTSVAFYATETCDDGNRNDFDGCSADCMHRDLFISACQLQLDAALPQPMEAILYMPQQALMLLSTAPALYSLKFLPSPGDTSVQTTWLLSKTLSVTDLFVSPSGGALLYSAAAQQVWQWTGPEATALRLYQDLSNILNPWTSHAYLFSSLSYLFMQDEHSIAALNLNTGSLVGSCTLAQDIGTGCFFMGTLSYGDDTVTMACGNNRVTIYLSPSFACQYVVYPFMTQSRNLWTDAFQAIQNTLFWSFINYELMMQQWGTGTYPFSFFYTQLYTPMGMWAEVPLGSPRIYVNNLNSSTSITPFLGDPTILLSASAPSITCASNAPCIYDLSTDYDLLQASGTNNGGTTQTWQSVLQQAVLTGTQGTGITTFPALLANDLVYGWVMGNWTQAFTQITLSKRVLSTAVHPATGNLWLVRHDGLFEVATSGRQIQVSGGGGTCMPAMAALCPACYWAPAGSMCVPCAQQDKASYAWWILCSQQAQCVGSNARRLLQSSPPPVLIHFVVSSPNASSIPSTLRSAAPCVNASSTVFTRLNSTGGVSWDVQVWTTDPSTCMSQLKPVLLTMHVLLAPQNSVSAPAPTSANSNSMGNSGNSSTTTSSSSTTTTNVTVIVGVSVGGVVAVLLVMLVLFLCVFRHHPHNIRLRAPRTGYHMAPYAHNNDTNDVYDGLLHPSQATPWGVKLRY